MKEYRIYRVGYTGELDCVKEPAAFTTDDPSAVLESEKYSEGIMKNGMQVGQPCITKEVSLVKQLVTTQAAAAKILAKAELDEHVEIFKGETDMFLNILFYFVCYALLILGLFYAMQGVAFAS